MKTTIQNIIRGALCFASTISLSWADVRYVDIHNATPQWPYNEWTNAANAIQPAINAAAPGDTVLVADGIYHITTEIKVWTSLTIQSVNGWEVTTINANENCRVVRAYANNGPFSLSGFTITGGYVDGSNESGGGIAASGTDPIQISNCRITGNHAVHGGGIHIGGVIGMHLDVVIQNCIVENNQADIHGGGLHVPMWKERTGTIVIKECMVVGNQCSKQGGGIKSLSNDGFVSVERCLIADNTAGQSGGGIFLGEQSMVSDSLIIGNTVVQYGGGGVNGPVDGSSLVINCTIADNQAHGGGGVQRAIILNSIVYGNQASFQSDIGPTSWPVFSCSPGLTPGVDGNMNADPQFTDPASGDYRLFATSPCIDAGTNVFVFSDIDLDWNPRIVDGNLDDEPVVDMGAYEFQVLETAIDIKPGSDTNPINLNSRGQCPVAVLTSEAFNASGIDPASIRLSDARPVHQTAEDVDADGDLDLLLHFNTQELNLTAASSRIQLTGLTFEGLLVFGTDTIEIIPKKK